MAVLKLGGAFNSAEPHWPLIASQAKSPWVLGVLLFLTALHLPHGSAGVTCSIESITQQVMQNVLLPLCMFPSI